MGSFNVLLTGFSGAGKSTLGFKLGDHLTGQGIKSEVLDGDVYRAVLMPNAGHTAEERDALRKKIIFIAKLLNKHGVSCILPFLSSSRKIRDYARKELPNFIEVYVRCPIEVCMARDPKGLYRRGKSGEETNIVGIHIPYEEPQSPDVVVHTDKHSVDECVNAIIQKITELKYVSTTVMEQVG